MISNTIINLYWKHDYLLGQTGNRDDNPVFLVCKTTTDSQWSKPVSYPITGPDSPIGLQQVEVLRISTQLAYEGGNISPTHQLPLPPQEILLVLISVRLSRPQGHSAARTIMLMKNSKDTRGNQTHNLPACRIKSSILEKTTGKEKLRINLMLLILADVRNTTPFVILKRKKLLKEKLPSRIIFQCNEQGWMTWTHGPTANGSNTSKEKWKAGCRWFQRSINL